MRGKAAVAAQALLLQHERSWQIKFLANEAGISAGLAHRLLARLEAEAVVAATAAGPRRVRRLTNPTALLDLLVEENVQRPTRTLGHALAQTPQQLIKSLGTNLAASGVEYAVTGAAAASLTAPFATAIPIVDVWVREGSAPEELCRAAKAEGVTEGQNVVFLQAKGDTTLAYREKAKGLWIANRVQVYLDLRRDPRRGRDQANHFRQEIIGF